MTALICIAGASGLTYAIWRWVQWWQVETRKCCEPLDKVWDDLQSHLNARRYLRSSTSRRLRSAIRSAKPPLAILAKSFFPRIRTSWARFEPIVSCWDGYIAERNERFVQEELARLSTWFDTICGYPLTNKQREAAIRDEDRVRVIAGAGTGKTSTVISKALYLLEQQKASPDSLLLLAFNKGAAEEIRARLAKAGHKDIKATTFHALGLSAVASHAGKKPDIHKLSNPDDRGALPRWIEEQIEASLKDPRYRFDAMMFLSSYLVPFRPRGDFASDAEFLSYLASLRMKTLKGEAVKSYGELLIANFLFLNGIAYLYEPPYEHPTATIERRQYKPDFFLPKYRIYIEYFGVDRQGRTKDNVNATDYASGMDWKRTIHREHQTQLVELFAYDHFEGKLEKRLEQELRKREVVLDPASSEDVDKLPQKDSAVSRLANLSATFTRLYKANHSETPLSELDGSSDSRFKAFIRLYQPIFQKYQRELSDSEEIDFDDMVGQATKAIRAGHGPRGLTNIIVDEFQDLSLGRKRMLDSLLAANPETALFCVGDDWQSIYRFTGSDIGMMTEFNERFGPGLTLNLDSTFRYPSELLKVSSTFIQQNPKQLKKTLRASKSLGQRPVVLRPADKNALQVTLDCISKEDSGASVFLLGRYNDDRLPYEPRGLKIEFSTVHRAKGREADYVVILNGAAGLKGFPSEIASDPILNVLYPPADSDDYAEERRLFYVALTRARKKVFYLVNPMNPSRFAKELAESPGVSSEVTWRTQPCSRCGTGHFIRREGRYGPFLGCSNYPICENHGKLAS